MVRRASGNLWPGQFCHGSLARPGVRGQVALQTRPVSRPAGRQPALQGPWGLTAAVGTSLLQTRVRTNAVYCLGRDRGEEGIVSPDCRI